MKTFIIYLKEREHSVRQSIEMFKTLTDYGHDVEYFEGVSGTIAVELAKQENRSPYPYSIKSLKKELSDIQDYIIPKRWNELSTKYNLSIFEKQPYSAEELKKISRPGVIGCFYSHYKLWERCVMLDEPIIIFEDDIKFFRNVEVTDWEDVLILALGKRSYLKDPWKTYLEDPSGTPRIIPWKNATMPGNQGYAIRPKAAKRLIKKYHDCYLPADNAINQQVCQIEISTYIMGREMLTDEGNLSSIKTRNGDPW
jgi:GR25 family glycosyltransferase involved in LPS biosynthesis